MASKLRKSVSFDAILFSMCTAEGKQAFWCTWAGNEKTKKGCFRCHFIFLFTFKSVITDTLDGIPQVKYNIAQVEYEIQADLY